ncbi:9139_t:CDS:2 [Entrophospora sp. SA101]|nr:9139_t:CDS:2 [Entrophospora sp. SA101]
MRSNENDDQVWDVYKELVKEGNLVHIDTKYLNRLLRAIKNLDNDAKGRLDKFLMIYNNLKETRNQKVTLILFNYLIKAFFENGNLKKAKELFDEFILTSLDDEHVGKNSLEYFEKAFNMIELVAVKYSRRRGRPLVLIINNIHAFKDDEDGEDLLELLQQRAESWAAAKLVTIIFNTDDYTVYERMKRDASRMEVIRVNNLGNDEAIKLLKQKRRGRESDEVIESIISRIGGRLLYINRLGRENNLVETADKLEEEERTWMTNTIGLIPDFEETAFEEQKYASCAWKLIRELIKSPTKSLPVNQCRIITGNPKWVRMLDHDNLIMIDDQQNVRPDSKILEKCFEEVVNSEGFDELLDNVCERVEEVDKEQRTRELIWSRKNDQTVRVGKPTKKGWLW